MSVSTMLLLAAWAGTLLPSAHANPPAPSCLWLVRSISDAKMWDKMEEASSEERLVELQMFESLRIESPQACRTGGLGPCVGIAIVNVKTRAAYVAHLLGAASSVKDYQALFEIALKEAANPADLQVVLAGVAIPPKFPEGVNREEVTNSMKALAEGLREFVAKSGIPEQHVTDKMRVVPDGKTYELFVDTKKKKIYLSASRE